MITELTDEKLAEFDNGDIAGFIREEHYKGDKAPIPEAIDYYIGALRMDAKVREDVFRLFRSAPLLCSECGRPSCLHGYPDY